MASLFPPTLEPCATPESTASTSHTTEAQPFTLPPRADIWRGNALAQPALPGIGTGFAALDAELPGGGWPAGALTELFPETEGIGEFALLAPALARLTAPGACIACIAPPWQAHAPALAAQGIEPSQVLFVRPRTQAETLWAARQALASRACAAVLVWLARADMASLRRLQLAAEGSHALTVLVRPAHEARQASPAALKLALQAELDGLAVRILKRRGQPLATPIVLPQLQCMARALPGLMQPALPAADTEAEHAVAGPLSARPAAAGSYARIGNR